MKRNLVLNFLLFLMLALTGCVDHYGLFRSSPTRKDGPPPMPAFSPSVGSEGSAPAAHTERVAWDWSGSAVPSSGFILRCTNAATNLVVYLPVTVRTNAVFIVEGAKFVSVTATTSTGSSAPCSIIWISRLDRYQLLFGEVTTNLGASWFTYPLTVQTNALQVGSGMLRTGITNWYKWGGSQTNLP